MASESVAALKLLEKGFKKEDLALAVLIDFPLQIVIGYYAAKWSTEGTPLRPVFILLYVKLFLICQWIVAYIFRLTLAALTIPLLYYFPSNGVTMTYYAAVLIMTVLTSFSTNIMFASLVCNKI